AFTSTSSSRTAPPSPRRSTHVLARLEPIALRTGDEVQVASSDIDCQVNRDQGAVWLDCFAFRRTRAIPGSFGASISGQGVALERFDSKGNSRSLVERRQPSRTLPIGIPVPKRKGEGGTVPVGDVLPIGGSPVVCDIERPSRQPTMFCTVAGRVTGSNNALNVTPLPATYGMTISAKGVALVRWNRDGTYQVVARRREPTS